MRRAQYLGMAAAALLYTPAAGDAATPPPPCDNLMVFFDPGSDRLSDKAGEVVDEAFRIGSGDVGRLPIQLAGVADPEEHDGDRLAHRRAEIVKARLIADGLKGDQIEIIPTAASWLLAPQPRTAADHALNRRVVLMPACDN